MISFFSLRQQIPYELLSFGLFFFLAMSLTCGFENTAGWTDANTKDYKGPTTQIVAMMAENVREKLASTYTICESGTAGPTGGTTPNRTPLVFSSPIPPIPSQMELSMLRFPDITTGFKNLWDQCARKVHVAY